MEANWMWVAQLQHVCDQLFKQDEASLIMAGPGYIEVDLCVNE